jgi:phosphatidate cytidylyltransferase
LHSYANGNLLILLVVMTVATADIGAYFFGKIFGKHQLVSAVSPGKSWEGFWGGLITCMLLAALVAWAANFRHWIQFLVIIVLVALASVIGDLVESMVKRHRGVKDSGAILPGHGGILDRIDGLTAAAPVFALAIIFSDWKI